MSDCDFCGERATGEFSYEDDPDFEYIVCADCPQLEKGNEFD